MLMMQELTTDPSDRLVAHEKDFLELYEPNIVSIKKAKIKYSKIFKSTLTYLFSLLEILGSKDHWRQWNWLICLTASLWLHCVDGSI